MIHHLLMMNKEMSSIRDCFNDDDDDNNVILPASLLPMFLKYTQ